MRRRMAQAEVRNVVSAEIALIKVEGLRAVRILRRVDALKVTMTVPKSVGRKGPVGEARAPGVGDRLPTGGTSFVPILSGDVCSRDKPSDSRRY